MNALLPKLNFKKRRQDNDRMRLIITGLVAFAIGLLVANLMSTSHNPNYELASGSDIKQAKADIEAAYLSAGSTECDDSSDPNESQDRAEVFKEYLKVNRYANRAVIRGCGDIDSLLYKDEAGVWQASNVNISLDLRANPAWQRECLIDDITEADDVIRPENSSIDTNNLVGCRMLDEFAQVRKFIESDPTVPEITNDDIQSHINGAEEWSGL